MCPVRTMTIDVDGTLVDDDGKMYSGVPAKLKQWRKKYFMICWSATGGDYARRTCTSNAIDKYFDLFLDKPDVIVDNSRNPLTPAPALLHVTGVKEEWWAQSDDEMFAKSRQYAVGMKECKCAKKEVQLELPLNKKDEE